MSYLAFYNFSIYWFIICEACVCDTEEPLDCCLNILSIDLFIKTWKLEHSTIITMVTKDHVLEIIFDHENHYSLSNGNIRK